MTNDDFSMKELLTQIVIPRLDNIDKKLDLKADLTEVIALHARLATVETSILRTDSVKQLITEAMTTANDRQWTRGQQVIAALIALFALASFVLSLLTYTHH